jgi:hypothetical protein
MFPECSLNVPKMVLSWFFEGLFLIRVVSWKINGIRKKLIEKN